VAHRIAGQYLGSLSNGGESLLVRGFGDSLIQQLTYSDNAAQGWPAKADGQGFSLQAIDPRVDCPSPINCNWRSSAVVGGTPAEPEYAVGDANLDRVFNSSDLVLVMQAGKYENNVPGDATWQEGDWDGDGDFATSDLVLAFQEGNYVAATVASAASLPRQVAAALPDGFQVAKDSRRTAWGSERPSARSPADDRRDADGRRWALLAVDNVFQQFDRWRQYVHEIQHEQPRTSDPWDGTDELSFFWTDRHALS
jgi:hypothetical protein